MVLSLPVQSRRVTSRFVFRRRDPMPKVKANNIIMTYDQQGTGEPLILIPYLAADYSCYGFQVAEYAKHFTCISIDLRGTGESDKPEGVYSTELFADDVAAFMQAVGIPKAHISGLSLGAASGMWLAAKYPNRVKSLSLHSGWATTDPFLKTVVEGWQVTAKALNSVPEMIILSIFPWCFTPELYAAKPDYIQSLPDFLRCRPEQPPASYLVSSKRPDQRSVSVSLSLSDWQLGHWLSETKDTRLIQTKISPSGNLRIGEETSIFQRI